MSQAQLPNELATFLETWTTDPNNAKDAFVRFKDFLLTTPDVRFDFKARPGVSYSLRAANAKNDERPLFVLVDVVDDEPEARWLSVCFYADMVNDPDELGDFVPSGLMGKDACCLNLEEDDPAMRDYILARLGEAPRPPRNNARNGVSNSPSPIGAGPQCAQRRQAATPSLFSLCGEAIPCRDGVPEWRNAALLL